jgi:hypothetical protein
MTRGRTALAAAVITVALAEAFAIALFLLVPGKWAYWLIAGLTMPTLWIAAELLSRNKASLRLAVAYAAVMIAVSEALAIAKALEVIAPDNEAFALRFLGIAGGLVIVFYGNIAPKQAACVDPASPHAGRQQAFQRYFGWVLFLAGIANTLVWALAPIRQAALWSMVPLVAAIGLIVLRIASARAARENRA